MTPPMTNDLIERLRARIHARPGDEHAVFVNPDGPEAAAHIEALAERIRELEAGAQELLTALRRYGFPVSGGAKVALGAWGSAEAMAVEHTTCAMIAILEQGDG
jgi:hypothetical protein